MGAMALSLAATGSHGRRRRAAAPAAWPAPRRQRKSRQAMLNNAAGDSKNFLHTNGNYDQTAVPSGRPDHHRATSRICRSAWIFQTDVREVDGNLADHRQRRDVCDHLVRPRLCAQCADRRADLALQARDGADHGLLLRAEQSRRRGLRRQGLSRHARRQARRARRQDRQAGLVRSRSPIPRSATARRWRRPPSTGRS